MAKKVHSLLLLCLVVMLSVLQVAHSEPKAAETAVKGTQNAILYSNGQILTMLGDKPEYAQALVTLGQNIAYVGNKREALERYPQASEHDLDGRTLLPGFIDPHSHFSMVINAIGQANVSPPPVGDVQSFSDLIAQLKRYQSDFDINDGEWIFAWGYDENQLAEKRHITVRELDAAFPNNPVYLQHVSGHLGVANTLALQQGGIDKTTPDPQGGKIIRFADSDEPTGQVQEVAIYFFAGKAIKDFIPKKADLFVKAQDYYLENGVTTAQDGMTDPLNMAFFKQVAASGELKMDLVTVHSMDSMLENDLNFGEYQGHLKPQGIKLIADGSPQGKTAYFTEQYLTEVEGCESNCVGYPHMSQEQLDAAILRGYKNNFQMFIHGNGDAAIDMIIAAHEKASKALKQALDKDRRTIVIHAQFIRPDQLETFKRYNILPSFFTNHAYFFGDVHVENLGEERAFFLSPLKAASELGLVYSNHSDETVTPINPLFGIYTAVNRTSRSGKVIGAQQRISPYQAIKAVTTGAAYQIFEQDIKGSLAPGMLADLVILDQNPLTVAPEAIQDIKVVSTIKNGQPVFTRKDK